MAISKELKQKLDKLVEQEKNKEVKLTTCLHTVVDLLSDDYNDAFDGYGPLHIAAAEGLTDIIKLFLKLKKYDFNMKTGDEQRTALMLASAMGQTEAVKLLLTRPGLEIDAEDVRGVTALRHACMEGHVEIVDLLLKHGANVNHQAGFGLTPLIVACDDKLEHILDRLLKHPGLNINAVTASNSTALFAAAGNCSLAIVKKLIEHGADATILAKAISTGEEGYAWQCTDGPEARAKAEYLFKVKAQQEQGQFNQMQAANRKVLINQKPDRYEQIRSIHRLPLQPINSNTFEQSFATLTV